MTRDFVLGVSEKRHLAYGTFIGPASVVYEQMFDMQVSLLPTGMLAAVTSFVDLKIVPLWKLVLEKSWARIALKARTSWNQKTTHCKSSAMRVVV